MNLEVVLEPSEEGGYTAYVPALPGCISEGDTRAEEVAAASIGASLEAVATSSPFPGRSRRSLSRSGCHLVTSRHPVADRPLAGAG